MKAVGYIRVSTEDQTQGVSLDNQKAKIKAYADLKDLEEKRGRVSTFDMKKCLPTTNNVVTLGQEKLEPHFLMW